MTITPHDLSQFTGGGPMYRHWLPGITFTEGVKYFADTAGAHWFLDILATEPKILAVAREFAAITMTVNQGKADIRVTDGGIYSKTLEKSVYTTYFTRHIDFTDCPDGEWKFYMIGKTILLPSEY